MKTIFDELVGLSEEEFEHRRREIIENYIRSLPEEKQRRARNIQFQIDLRLSRSPNKYIEMQKMFWDQFMKFNDALNSGVIVRKDNVLPFKGR